MERSPRVSPACAANARQASIASGSPGARARRALARTGGSDRMARAPLTARPHCGQNYAGPGSSLPQAGQDRAMTDPQCMQNRASAGLSSPQLGQSIRGSHSARSGAAPNHESRRRGWALDGVRRARMPLRTRQVPGSPRGYPPSTALARSQGERSWRPMPPGGYEVQRGRGPSTSRHDRPSGDSARTTLRGPDAVAPALEPWRGARRIVPDGTSPRPPRIQRTFSFARRARA